MDSVTIHNIRLSYHRPPAMRPEVMAMSWGAATSAHEAVEEIFGCIPFPYQSCIDFTDTPTGLAKRLKRMHAPERMFAARQERIKKHIMKKDPLFYDQFIDQALENDTYTLEYYRDRQAAIEQMHRRVAVKPDQVGKLWISPEADRLKKVDWPGLADELRELVIGKMDVYEAQNLLLEREGLLS